MFIIIRKLKREILLFEHFITINKNDLSSNSKTFIQNYIKSLKEEIEKNKDNNINNDTTVYDEDTILYFD